MLTEPQKSYYWEYIHELRGNQARIALLWLMERIEVPHLKEALEVASTYPPDSGSPPTFTPF